MSKNYSIVGMEHQKSETLVAALGNGVVMTLVREPKNQFDANAVAVWVDGQRVGYIPKKQNGVLAQFIDQSGGEPSFFEPATIAMDKALLGRAITAKFIRSPNSGYPMVQVD